LRSEVVGDSEQATASWCKRGYGRNERVARLGKAESTNLADTPLQNCWKSYSVADRASRDDFEGLDIFEDSAGSAGCGVCPVGSTGRGVRSAGSADCGVDSAGSADCGGGSAGSAGCDAGSTGSAGCG